MQLQVWWTYVYYLYASPFVALQVFFLMSCDAIIHVIVENMAIKHGTEKLKRLLVLNRADDSKRIYYFCNTSMFANTYYIYKYVDLYSRITYDNIDTI